jgi:hypothetical protein
MKRLFPCRRQDDQVIAFFLVLKSVLEKLIEHLPDRLPGNTQCNEAVACDQVTVVGKIELPLLADRFQNSRNRLPPYGDINRFIQNLLRKTPARDHYQYHSQP